ncbi:MAG: hypothetical protein ACI93T_001667 [Porticoccaceae bacterium]|jgi:hypothetical protein
MKNKKRYTEEQIAFALRPRSLVDLHYNRP